MQLKTILNHVEKQKGFVYEIAHFDKKEAKLRVYLRPRRGSRPICSGCGRKGPGYDSLGEREFEFVPLWAIAVFFVYVMRRVNCSRCGVTVEQVPWSDGKHRTTFSYRVFLSRWAKRLSWKETATVFGASWDTVYRSVSWVVRWGLAHREEEGIEAIGIDEIQYRKGHRYLTLVYQIDAGRRRLLYVAKDRTEASLRGFFGTLSESSKASLKYVCTDMWRQYLTVVAEEVGHAVHVLDRFHVMKKFGEKLDKVRAEEARRMKENGEEPLLKHSR